MSSAVAIAGVYLLATLAPFETTTPILQLPWQSISNLEAALMLALGAWALALGWGRRVPAWREPLVYAWAAFVVAMAVSAVFAPAQHLNAWHMTGRLTAAAAVFLLTTDGVTNSARLRTVLILSVASGAVVAILAVLEYAQVDAVLRWLQAFRPSISTVGAQVRAGGSLQYPTIASMYLEVVFAFGLGLMLHAVDASLPVRSVLWFAVLLIIGEAIALTFTRAGLITMAASLLIVGILRSRRAHSGRVAYARGSWLLATLALALTVSFMSTRSTRSLWLRFTSEGQDAWYRARIDAPPDLALKTDDGQWVPITVTNVGRLPWDSTEDPPILLSYHWLAEDGARVVAFNGARTEFDRSVEPGESATLRAFVRAPRRPGAYRLEWDVLQEGVLWFSTEQGAPPSTFSHATVTGPAMAGPLVTVDHPSHAVRPGRLVLWRAALAMFAAHPWLGVGPDNFRLLYGGYAGLERADTRTHSNNMYLEVLAGGGLLAAAAFLWFMREAVAVFIAAGRGRRPEQLALVAAGLAIAFHAVVDSFISFAPTYILFSLTLGLAAAVARGLEPAADAHRI